MDAMGPEGKPLMLLSTSTLLLSVRYTKCQRLTLDHFRKKIDCLASAINLPVARFR